MVHVKHFYGCKTFSSYQTSFSSELFVFSTLIMLEEPQKDLS